MFFGLSEACIVNLIDFFLYFKVFAYVGFMVAVVWIYSVANEVVNILQVKKHIPSRFFSWLSLTSYN